MPQSANDQVERGRWTAMVVCIWFQCLSRQTIKWNNAPAPSRSPPVSFQCLSRQTIKWNYPTIHQQYGALAVSMPQSANDQVERGAAAGAGRGPDRFNASVGKRSSGTNASASGTIMLFKFQCLSRQTIKWNRRHGRVILHAKDVSMPQSANDQVERTGALLVAIGTESFNASVGKRSSGT